MSAFPILMLLLIAAAFWFLVLRPARQRQREQSSLLSSLTGGSDVMTTAGLFGTVRAINGDRISLEIADGVVVEYLNLAIAKVVSQDDESASTSQLPEEETVVITESTDPINSSNHSS